MRAMRFTKKKGEEEVGCRLIGCVSAYGRYLIRKSKGGAMYRSGMQMLSPTR